jgi:uracil-DNA glycosylase
MSLETPVTAPMTYGDAVNALKLTDWGNLCFFATGAAAETAARVDETVMSGVQVLPAAKDVFKALEIVQPDQVKAVILGQDPYPTPGDAHGLAFSVANPAQRIPASLKTIFASLEADLEIIPPPHGNLIKWAHAGILLLNVTLSVEAGKANSHKNFGWANLAGEILDRLNEQTTPIVFMLWGKYAQQTGARLDTKRHCVIKTVHPSPLAHGGGRQHKFVTSQPFAQAQELLSQRGLPPIDWRL